ncbi:hypothetical protein BJ970_002479 [Saccharopolyspora phatthalungensis]|uniref:Uncharacterized protein n=1 Tax=Saccharopolyspora phatthalungensis TaxID=664693 RepID=A0A840Q926_9PSEU|nr:hypothetical protein [Saccharopolyspora phatthalungensis]
MLLSFGFCFGPLGEVLADRLADLSPHDGGLDG